MLSFVIICTLFMAMSCCAAKGSVQMAYGKINADKTYESFCDEDNVCVQISNQKLMATFKNFFMTKKQMKERERMLKKERYTFLKHEGVSNVTSDDKRVGDGDSCCPTAFDSVVKVTMINIVEKNRTLIHMTNLSPPQYQFISQAKCVGSGTCKGKCVIEPTIATLLIFDPSIKNIAFDTFQVPGYCSCKNIS